MKNLDKFQKNALPIGELGETTIVVSIEHEAGGEANTMLKGSVRGLIFAMASTIYQISTQHDVPLEDIGDMLNHYMTKIQKLDKEGRICDSNT